MRLDKLGILTEPFLAFLFSRVTVLVRLVLLQKDTTTTATLTEEIA